MIEVGARHASASPVSARLDKQRQLRSTRLYRAWDKVCILYQAGRAGPNTLGPAGYAYGFRTRCRKWPPRWSTRLSCELE
jgi:hypothetical protein